MNFQLQLILSYSNLKGNNFVRIRKRDSNLKGNNFVRIRKIQISRGKEFVRIFYVFGLTWLWFELATCRSVGERSTVTLSVGTE